MSHLTCPMGRLWSFFFQTFRISYGEWVEQVRSLRNGIWAIWKFEKSCTGPPTFGQCYDDSFLCLSEARKKRQWRNKRWQQQIMAEKPDRLWLQCRIQYRTTNWILLKIGHAPITNVISNTYCIVSVIPYWELTHRANPNIHRTPW